MNAHSLLMLTTLSSFFVLSACTPQAPQDAVIDMANPASVFCVQEKQGRIEIVTDTSGNQKGLCHLPDGTVVDEWELFRKEGSQD